jgi:DNA-binding response OmpR family regulator
MAAKVRRGKSNFEIVPIPDLAPEPDCGPPRILSVSYDQSLARTRAMLLAAAGFDVETYTDLQRALKACKNEAFDLVIIGHSIPTVERKKLLQEVRSNCPTPVLALLRHGDAALYGADHVFDASQSPAQLLEMVANILQLSKDQR